MNKQKNATVAVINDGQLLILKRGLTAPWMPGKYCLPGGGVEDNETLEIAAQRELLEETGIKYSIDKFESLTIVYGNNYSKIVLIAMVNSKNVKLNYEHDEYFWINKNQADNYELVPRLGRTIRSLHKLGFIL